MAVPTVTSRSLREAIERDRARLEEVLDRYGASNPRLFGSVARRDAVEGSDLDLPVDQESGSGNPLLRVAGTGEELSELLGVKVDVVTGALLRDPVAVSAYAHAVPL